MNNLAAAVALLGAIFALVAINSSKRDEKSLKDLPSPMPEVIDLVKKGEKVKAIKIYRQQTSVSLYDANRVISSLNDAR